MPPTTQQLISELRDQLRIEIKNVREAVERDLRAEIRELRTEFRAEAHSIEHFNEVFEELENKCKTALADNVSLKEQNNKLRSELGVMQKRLAEAESRLLLSEQYSRNKNIEIKGIEENANEDVTDIVCKLGALADVPVTPEDIESCHRVPSKAKPSPIVVQFAKRQKRDDLIEKARKMRLSNKDFGKSSGLPIYVNEHLCPILKQLLGMTVAKKKATGWKYVWTRGGKICAKKSDDSATLIVRHEHDLEKIR